MPTLHYSNAQFEITNDEAQNLLAGTFGGVGLDQAGLVTVHLADGGTIHIVTGGIPLWIDMADQAPVPVDVF